MTRAPAPAPALPLALTMGDPAGIGAEIALAAWASGRVARPFFLIGDPARLAPLAERMGVPLAAIAGPEATASVFARA
ncbi:MAG: 4-hydroxythreonine-4-phosphate dehydrogenase, partial [Proteobacteria bacterium]|nr:4-hydroxythreonine-4-phosphate dehydrogenase [Pseudomonadota bacterium]